MRKIMSSVFQLTYIYDKSNAVCFHIIFQPYLLYVLFFDMPPSVTRILTTMYAPVKKEIYSPSRGEDYYVQYRSLISKYNLSKTTYDFFTCKNVI